MTALPYQRRSATSRRAAVEAAERAPTQHEAIYAYLAEHGPLTREQIALRTGIKESSVCARVNALLMGLEVDGRWLQLRVSGVDDTTSGRSAETLVVLEAGWRQGALL